MNKNHSRYNFIREYVRDLRQGKAALFAGAGLSIPSGGISWSKLLEEEAIAIGIDVNQEQDLTTVAQYIYNESGSRQIITQLIKNHINVYGQTNRNHEILSSLPISKVWTTNYDHYIEDSFKKYGKTVDVKRSIEDMTTSVEDTDTTIYKMHGDIGHPHNVVILKDDYEIYDRKNELFVQALQEDLIQNTFLFFGFSFDDPNLQNILAKIRIKLEDTKRRHYCILKRVSEEDEEFKDLNKNERKEAFESRENMQTLKVNDFRRYGIHVVLVNSYDEMTEILQSIKHHYLSNRIFISGAYEEVESFLGYKGEEATQVADEFCRKLAQKLHQLQYKVKSGFGLGVGRNIVQGFLDEDANRNNEVLSQDLVIHPFPANMSDSEKLHYREKIIKGNGISLFMFGNKIDSNGKTILSSGVRDEYRVASKQGQFTVPIGLTGYTAATIWKKHLNFSGLKEMNIQFDKLDDDSFLNKENFEKQDKIDYLINEVLETLNLYSNNIDIIHEELGMS